MKHFSKEQLQNARVADLHSFLLLHHPESFKIEGSSLRLKDNYSLSIKAGYSGFLDFASGDKGNSIDFLVKYMNYELDDAVFALCGELATVSSKPQKSPPKTENLPARFPEPIKGSYKNLYAYLMRRGISKDTIQMLIDLKILYQDSHNNMIFANAERDWGEKRGTNSYADRRCKHRNICNQYSEMEHQWCSFMKACDRYAKDPFHGSICNCRHDGFWSFQTGKHPTKAFVCEAAIDAISLYEIRRIKEMNDTAIYVSIGGAAKQPAIDRLKKHVQTILAVDNDASGAQCRQRNPDLEFIIPVRKDWNDDLLMGFSHPN